VRKQDFCGCSHVWSVEWRCEVEVESVSFGHGIGIWKCMNIVNFVCDIMLCYIGVFFVFSCGD